MNLIIRPETEADFYATELMTKRAFWNVNRPGCDEHYLVHRLRDDAAYMPECSRVAEIDGKIVGTIMYAMSEIRRGDEVRKIPTFGPLCVDPNWKRKGVGAALLRETLPIVRDMGYGGVIIFGVPTYYPKQGFFTCDKWGITDEYGNNYDSFLGYELVPGGLDMPGAKFYEAKIFSDLPEDEVEKFDRNFPYMEKLKLPGQWR